MRKHAFVIFLVSCYIATQVCIEFGKAFLDVGAAKLHDFTWSDWICLIVPTAGSTGLIVLAFFSRAFATHMAELEKVKSGNTEFLIKPPATATVTVEKPSTTETTTVTVPTK